MAPQSYYIGGKIRAADFNEFIGDINDIVGIGVGDSGYGQDAYVITPITSGSKIRASNWDALLTAIHACATHQNSTISIPADVSDPTFPSPNRVVELLPTLVADINTVKTNKLNYDVANMAIETNKISTSKIYVDPTSGTPNWTGTVYYEFSTNFSDDNHRRHFFNLGGEIRVSSDLTPSGADAQSLDWDTLLASVATVKLAVNTTTSSGGVGNPGIGFNALTTTYQLVYTKGGTGDYSGNQLNVYAKLNATSGIDIKVSFDDIHAADTGPGWTGTDYVAGTLTVTVDQQRPNGIFSKPTPTYTHISEL